MGVDQQDSCCVLRSAPSGQGLVKSLVDTCSYRFLELPNGLRALLVHDPETDKAAASLDVSVRVRERGATDLRATLT